MKKLLAVCIGFGLAQAAWTQAPAGAPAGANGICKDGTYSTAATKDGACRGHKGVQTWYAASAAKTSAASPAKAAAAPAPVTPSKPATAAAKPASVNAAPASAPAKPLPSSSVTTASAPATSASSPKRSGPAAAAAAKPQAPGGGPGIVWVNTASNVYHCPGTDYYGKTKAGSYMSEADAKAKGARPDRGKACTQ